MLEMRSSRRLTTSRSTTSGAAPGYATPTNTIGCSMSGNSSVSSRASEARPNTTSAIIVTTLMIVFVSVVLGALGYLFSPALLRLMGVTEVVYEGALGFMRVSFVGLAFNFFFFMFQSIMRGVGEAKLPVYIVLGTVILNFILD